MQPYGPHHPYDRQAPYGAPQPYGSPYGGYGAPPPYGPPPPRNDRNLWIIGVVLAAFFLLVVVPFGVGIVIGIRNAAKKPTSTATSALTESYETANGLVRVHYPADFAAKRLDDATVIVSRNLGGKLDELVTIGAVERPISDDMHEFGRVLLNQVKKNVESRGGTWTKSAERSASCLGTYPGVEAESSWQIPKSERYVSKACFFMHRGHGYEVRYDVASSRAGADEKLLEKIEESLELLR